MEFHGNFRIQIPQLDYFLSVKHQKLDTTDAGVGYFSKTCLQEVLGWVCFVIKGAWKAKKDHVSTPSRKFI